MPEKMNCTKTIKYDGIVRVLNKVVDLAEPLPLEQGLRRLRRFTVGGTHPAILARRAISTKTRIKTRELNY